MNFDNQVNRYNTNSLKYDFKKQKNKPEDVYPMWVGDMDFKCCDAILNDINKRISHGIFGYSQTNSSYFEAIYNWYKKKHDVLLNEEWLVKTPGGDFSISMAIRTLTQEGDSILINNPVYYPFTELVIDNNRKIVSSDLINNNGHYEINFEDFENKIVENNVHLYLFCSPHNPVGRVWTKDEINKIIQICKKYNVYILSDEYHCEFAFDIPHTCILKYTEYLDNMIVCTSPGKTFNFSGLQISNVFIPNKKIRDKFQSEIWKTGYALLNTIGIVACESAYKNGEAWLEELKKYLIDNITYAEKYIKDNLPKIKVIHPEGTYLLWLDFNEFSLSENDLENKLINDAKLWLDNGSKFSEAGLGFQRMNIAVPKENLKMALEKLVNAFKNY